MNDYRLVGLAFTLKSGMAFYGSQSYTSSSEPIQIDGTLLGFQASQTRRGQIGYIAFVYDACNGNASSYQQDQVDYKSPYQDAVIDVSPEDEDLSEWFSLLNDTVQIKKTALIAIMVVTIGVIAILMVAVLAITCVVKRQKSHEEIG